MVPLDNRREWYRYHHLFADLLRYRLQRESPERLPELHRRACHWYAQAGRPDEAMHHAFAVPDYDLAADLAEQFMLQTIGSSRLGTYLGWIKQLPKDLVCSRAYLCAGCGWAYGLTHQHDAAKRYVEAGERALSRYEPVSNLPDGRRISREEVRGHLAALRSDADRHLGDRDGAIAHARQALEVLPQEALSVRCAVALTLGDLRLDGGEIERARQAFDEAFEMAEEGGENAYAAINALCSLGSIAVMRGKLHEAEALFQRAVQYGMGEPGAALPVPGAGLKHGWLVLLHYQRNEIERAQQHLDIVLQATEQMDDPQAVVRASLYQSLLDQSQGELNSAGNWLQRAEQIMQTHPVQELIQAEWINFRGQFYLAQGDVTSVQSLLSAQGFKPTDLDEQPAPGSKLARSLGSRLGCYLLLARTLLAQDAPDRAEESAREGLYDRREPSRFPGFSGSAGVPGGHRPPASGRCGARAVLPGTRPRPGCPGRPCATLSQCGHAAGEAATPGHHAGYSPRLRTKAARRAVRSAVPADRCTASRCPTGRRRSRRT